MSETVVDHLELIDVEIEYRQVGGVPVGARQTMHPGGP